MNHMHLLDPVAGDVIGPDDPAYAQAASIVLGQGDPAVVVRPRDAADVSAAVRYAAAEGGPLSVRSGGHNLRGFGTNSGGVMIDLSPLDTVEVLDLSSGLVRIGAGATWGAIGEALRAHGLALTSGDTRSVGVGGLTLGGGIGWMVRKYGLTIDSLHAVEIVTADGRVLRADAEENPDLFWAVRGGGGNVGVVTSFEFVAAPVRDVVAGTINLEFEDIPAILRGWRDAMRAAPDELSSQLLLLPGMGERSPAVNIFCCYAGEDVDTAMAAFAPLLEIGSVTGHDIVAKPYVDVLEEAHAPPGIRVVLDNALVREFDDDVVDAIDALYARGLSRMVFIRSLGGAMSRVPQDDTAFGHRDVEAMVVSGAFLPVEASHEDVQSVRKPWLSFAELGVGAYSNFSNATGAEEVARIYPPSTYARLAEIKGVHDPANLFSRNDAVEPTPPLG